MSHAEGALGLVGLVLVVVARGLRPARGCVSIRLVTDIAARYIDLVARTVNGDIHGQQIVQVPMNGSGAIRRGVTKGLGRLGLQLTRPVPVPESAYLKGVSWPASRANVGESMIGAQRLNNVRQAVEDVIAKNVPGDLIETGVWRGGATILMKAVLEAHGDTERRVYVADSFAGLPTTDRADDDAGLLYQDETLAVSQAQVRAAFERYGLLDDRVVFVEGWFKDTLPGLADRTWSVVRLDGDLYDSTMDGLVNLYPRLSPGGWLLVDDYGTYRSCREAIEDYRRDHNITEPIVEIDGSGIYWRRQG